MRALLESARQVLAEIKRIRELLEILNEQVQVLVVRSRD